MSVFRKTDSGVQFIEVTEIYRTPLIDADIPILELIVAY